MLKKIRRGVYKWVEKSARTAVAVHSLRKKEPKEGQEFTESLPIKIGGHPTQITKWKRKGKVYVGFEKLPKGKKGGRMWEVPADIKMKDAPHYLKANFPELKNLKRK